MSRMTTFSIGLVKPTKSIVRAAHIPATDRAWRTAIFGLGGSRKRIAGARIGIIDGQPLAIICELPDTVADGTPIWTIETEKGLFAFAGPAAVYNDAGFGPATLGISVERLQQVVTFDPEPEAMNEGLRRTLEAREPEEDEPTGPVHVDGNASPSGPPRRLSKSTWLSGAAHVQSGG